MYDKNLCSIYLNGSNFVKNYDFIPNDSVSKPKNQNANNSKYFAKKAFTTALWINGDNNSTNTASSKEEYPISFGYHTGVFNYAEDSSNNGRYWLVWDKTGGWKKVKYDVEFSKNTWYHILVTFDGSNLKAYLNGKLNCL